MSSPGFFYGDGTDQAQMQARQLAMAQSLMGNKANPNTSYAGLSNIGGDIAGAIMAHNANAANSSAAQTVAQRTGISPQEAGNIVDPSMLSRAGNWAGKLFGLGGGA